MFYRFSYAIAFILFKILFRIRIKGKEYIPKKGGFILASNHVSYLDPPAVGIGCWRRLNFMARYDLFDVPLLGWWMRNVGVFPVKRNTADLFALREAIRRVRKGEGLLVFPEGTRQASGVFGEPEAGVGFIAAKSKAPVIPVFIEGSGEALPKDARFIHFNKITVSFGKPVSFDNSMPYQDIAERIMHGIRILS